MPPSRVAPPKPPSPWYGAARVKVELTGMEQTAVSPPAVDRTATRMISTARKSSRRNRVCGDRFPSFQARVAVLVLFLIKHDWESRPDGRCVAGGRPRANELNGYTVGVYCGTTWSDRCDYMVSVNTGIPEEAGKNGLVVPEHTRRILLFIARWVRLLQRVRRGSGRAWRTCVKGRRPCLGVSDTNRHRGL
jgi:hypothetical protein